MVKVPLPQNASTKRYHQAQTQLATRPASGIKAKAYSLLNKDSQTALITYLSVSLCLNARRGTRRPLVVAFGA